MYVFINTSEDCTFAHNTAEVHYKSQTYWGFMPQQGV